MTVDAPLIRLLCRLQASSPTGEAWASEAGLRKMLAEDTGHMAGLDTIRRALVRFDDQGIIAQGPPLPPGGILPTGGVATYGTRLVAVPQCRRERAALRARARQQRPESRRVMPRALAELGGARRKIIEALKPMPSPAVDFERRRRAQLEALAALERDGFPEPEPARPPD